MKLSQLKPLEKNPFKSKGDKQIAAIGKSISEFEKMMQIRKIVVDENFQILGGNKRFFALKALGRVDIPDSWVDQVTGLTEAEKREFIVKDNSHWGSEWDFDLLKDWGVDLEDWGVQVDWEEPQPEASEDDYQIPDEIETDIVVGDLFEIGVHRLLCGDSTDKETVERLMGGEKADMVFTDPPYNMEMGGQGCFSKGMENTKKRIEKIINFNPFTISYLPSIDALSFYIFTSKDGIPQYLEIFKDYNFNILFWAKSNPTPFTHGTFLPDIEYIMYFNKKGSKIWNNSLKPTEIYKKYYLSQKLEGRDGFGDLHPTMKQIILISDKIKISSNIKGIVLDIFLGSGSTMVAAHQLNRRCYGLELEPRYCEVIIQRMRKLDPGIVIKKNGEVMQFTVN